MTSPGRRNLYEWVQRMGVVSWSLLGTLLFLGALIWVMTQVSNLIPAVVFSFALIYILNPVVTRFHRHGIPRVMGSCLSYLVLAGVFALIGWLIWPSISDQAVELSDRFPEIYDDIAVDLEGWADGLGITADIPRHDELSDFFRDNAQGDFVSRNLRRISDVTLTVLEFFLLLFFAPVIAFYVLMDLPKLKEQARSLMPPRHRREVSHVMGQLGTAVGGFLRGQLLVAFIVGVMTSFGFWLVDVPFWLLIGMIAGFLNIVPFVGPWVGGALGVFFGLTESTGTAIGAAAAAAIVQQIDNHFISPTVLRATVRLHPATIIFALLAGGTLAGIWGVLLAVPVTAIIKIITGHVWRTRVLGQSWEEATEALIDERPTTETLISRLRRVNEAQAEMAPPTDDVPTRELPPDEDG